MKKIIYKKNLSSYFYIKRIKDTVLIISIGPDNPFEYINALNKGIDSNSDLIADKRVEVYLDLLSCVGKNENRFSKLIFNKGNHQIDIDSIHAIKAFELPEDALVELKNFYRRHFKEAMRYSILTYKEKEELTLSAII